MLKKKFDSVDEAVKYFADLLDQEKSARANVSAEKVAAQAAVARLENDLESALENIKSLGDEISTAEDKIKALEGSTVSDALKLRIEELEEELRAAGQNLKEAFVNLNSAKAEKASADAEVSAALEQVTEMGKKLSILENNRGSENPIVEIGGSHYKILGNRFLVNGVECDAAALSKNTAELERMIKIGSGSLVEVETE